MKNRLFLLCCFLSINFWGQKTYVPDDNFEQALIDLGYDNTLDNYVDTNNISNVTNLQISYKGIQDLTGIEGFAKLENLFVNNNSLTQIDISSNTSLKRLDAYNNQIDSIDVSNNINLEVLFLYRNQLSNIDLSKNTKIYSLRLGHNNFTSLDLSKNLSLQYFYAEWNELMDIDLSVNNALIGVWIENNQFTSVNINNGNNAIITNFSVTNNPNLKCITVDYITNNRPIGWAKDNTATYNTDCTPKTYVPDDNFEQALIDLGYDDVLDNYVLTGNIEDVTSLDVTFKNISDLTGIEDFTSLVVLKCFENKLTSLNVSSNTALTELRCNGNQLTSLNVNANTLLTKLYCYSNKLSTLDIRNNVNLEYLYCGYNNLASLDLYYNEKLISLGCQSNKITSLFLGRNVALTSLFCDDNLLTSLDISNNRKLNALNCSLNQLINLNVKNGNNSSFTIFRISDNPNLYCVSVDDVTYSNNNWTSKDDIVSFRENCTNFDNSLNRFEENVTGNWNDMASWSLGHVPSSGDVIEIPSNSIITINEETFVEVDKIINRGYVNLNGKVTVQDEYVNTGTIHYNATGSIIASKSSGIGNFVFTKNSYKGIDLHPDNWYLVSLPGNEVVAQEVISNSTLANGTGTNKGLAIFNNSTSVNSGWSYFNSLSQDLIKPAVGLATKMGLNSFMYLRKFQNSINASFISSDYSVTITNGTVSGWNLIGNPYLASYPANSSLNGSSFLEVNESKLDPSFAALYFWNPDTNSYDVVNKATEETLINPMEGFFVKVNNQTEEVVFNRSSLVHSSSSVSNRSQNKIHEVSLIVSNGDKRKRTTLKYLSNTTKGLDVGYDAGLFNASNEKFTIYTILENGDSKLPLTLQCLPKDDIYDSKVGFGMKILNDAEIEIKAVSENLPDGVVLLLEDTVDNVFVDVTNPKSTYKTKVNKNDLRDRFFLHTISKSLGNDDNLSDDNLKIIKMNADDIVLKGLEEMGEFFLYNIEGKLIKHQKVSPKNNVVKVANHGTGVYIINVLVGEKRVTKKIILE